MVITTNKQWVCINQNLHNLCILLNHNKKYLFTTEYGLARKVLFASLVAATGWSIKACLSWWSSSKSVNDSDGAIQWEKVGQVGQLLWYPIKSMGPVSVLKLNVTKSGIKSELLKDRILVVTDSLGRVIRVRNYPKIVQVLTLFI